MSSSESLTSAMGIRATGSPALSTNWVSSDIRTRCFWTFSSNPIPSTASIASPRMSMGVPVSRRWWAYSTTVTAWPRVPSSSAQASPAIPAPETRMFTCALQVSLRWVCDRSP